MLIVHAYYFSMRSGLFAFLSERELRCGSDLFGDWTCVSQKVYLQPASQTSRIKQKSIFRIRNNPGAPAAKPWLRAGHCLSYQAALIRKPRLFAAISQFLKFGRRATRAQMLSSNEISTRRPPFPSRFIDRCSLQLCLRSRARVAAGWCTHVRAAQRAGCFSEIGRTRSRFWTRNPTAREDVEPRSVLSRRAIAILARPSNRHARWPAA